MNILKIMKTIRKINQTPDCLSVQNDRVQTCCVQTSHNRLVVILLISVILQISFASADIYISEVLYNPFITESGGEAVELYNSGNDAINISGYTLKTASSNSDATLPEGTFISPKGYYLVTDANWDTKKDDILFPSADYEEPITMANTNSGVALIDKQGNTVDAVGWGALGDVPEGLYDGTPANNTGNSESLQRIAFTGNNLNDFTSATPNLTNSYGFNRDVGINAIYVNVVVQNPDYEIINLTADFDIDDKIILNPGSQRDLNVTFSITEDINPDQVYVTWDGVNYAADVLDNSGGYVTYASQIPLDFFFEAGDYTLTAVCEMDSYDITASLSTQVLPLLAFEMDLKSINCSLATNQSCLILGDTDILTLGNPTIMNTGNKPLDFEVSGSNLTNQGKTIDVSNMKFSFAADNPSNEITNNPTLYDVGLAAGANSYLPLSLLVSIPEQAEVGAYNSRLLFMGVLDES